MLKLAFIAIVATCSLFAGSVSAKERKELTRLVNHANAGVNWDISKAFSVDLNGDDKRDFALVGVDKEKVYVAVVIGPLSKKALVDISVFAVDSGLQQAICGLPALLESESLDYTPQDVGMDAFDDFTPSKKAMGLRLSGGGCDPVHLYWGSKKKKLLWWRR